MRFLRTLFLAFVAMLLAACERFEIKQNADTFYHLQVNDAIIPVWVRGNLVSKKIIVFINGGPGLTSIDVARMDLLGWEANLEKEVAMVYYDQRGTGNAQGIMTEGDLTLDNYLKDLKAVIESLHAKYPETDVYLMGHSFGGLIGQSFLLNKAHRDMVKGWINISGSTVVDSEIEWSYRLEFLRNVAIDKITQDSTRWSEALDWAKRNDPIESSEQKEEWRSFIGHAGEGIIPDEDLSVTAADFLGITFNSSYNVFPAYISSNSSLTGLRIFEDVKGTNLLPVLHKIDLPVLTIWGKYDDIVPLQLGLDAFDAIGTADDEKSFIILENAGHQPFINEPALFKEEVKNFVMHI